MISESVNNVINSIVIFISIFIIIIIIIEMMNNNVKIIKMNNNDDNINDVNDKFMDTVKQKVSLIEERAKYDARAEFDNDMTSPESFSKYEGTSIEGFQTQSNTLENIPLARLHKKQLLETDTIAKNATLTLYYSSGCPYSQTFMPTWFLIKDAFEKNNKLQSSHGHYQVKEYECTRDSDICKKEGIVSVPSMILNYVDVNGMKRKRLISGSRTYSNIVDELYHLGVNLSIEHHPEETNDNTNDNVSDTNYISEGFSNRTYYISPTEEDIMKDNEDPDCPYISFYEGNKNYFCASGRNISGCVNGSRGSNLSPFDAAYTVVGTYLSSLPDSSQAKMNKCAMLKKDNIKSLRLCDGTRLNKKSNFQKLIDSGKSKPLFDNVDYSENNKIVNAINRACIES